MPKLFLLSLSPVQGFIERARKTSDLYTASSLLSALTLEGLKSFEKKLKGEAIFPNIQASAISSFEEETSLPNRFLGSFEWNGEPKDLEPVILEIVQDIKQTFKQKAEQALEKAHSEKPKGFDEQIEQHLQIHWVVQDYGAEQGLSYEQAYEKIEKCLASIKNLQTFEQFAYQDQDRKGEFGRKCSLEGDLNALFYAGNRPPYMNESNALELKNSSLKQGEALSALGFLKRFCNKTNFPSIAQICLSYGIDKLYEEAKINEEAKNKVKKLTFFKALFSKDCKEIMPILLQLKQEEKYKNLNLSCSKGECNTDFDLQYLYEENLIAKNFPNPDQLTLLQSLAQEIRQGFLEFGQGLQKYYALVLFDGDNMGKWLSGELVKEAYKKGEGLKAFHQAFSAALIEFAKKAKNLLFCPNVTSVQETKNDLVRYGKTVYAGGDDFLGFVALDSLFETLNALRKSYAECVITALEPYAKDKDKLSFSAGIVIAHYKEPLSVVLQKARATEKTAKKKGLRNAFALTVLKGSGEIHETVFPWGNAWQVETESLGAWESLARIQRGLEENKLSTKFIKHLCQMFQDLAGPEMNKLKIEVLEQRTKLILAELRRLVFRAKTEGTEEEEIEKINQALENLWHLALKLAKKLAKITLKQGYKSEIAVLRYFIHSLFVVDFIQRKREGGD